MNNFLMEKANLKQGFLPVDLNTAANTGARISLDKADRCSIILLLGDSTSATAVTLTLKQHNAATSGTSKALSVANPYYHKVGAATKFTKVTPTVASDVIDATTLFANDEGILVAEVCGEDLDVSNGFNHISADVEDAGAAKIGALLYMLHDCRYLPPYGLDI